MTASLLFQCNACRVLGSAADFVVADGGLQAGLVCSSCKATSWLPVSGERAATIPATPSTVTTATMSSLPSRQVFDDTALLKVRERLERLPLPAPTQLELRERFEQLLATSWENEAEHKKLLQSAALQGELAFVGGRYRAVLDVVRDDPRAKAAQQELLTMAMATMTQLRESGSVPQTRHQWARVAVVLLLIAALIGGGVFLKKAVYDLAALNKSEQ